MQALSLKLCVLPLTLLLVAGCDDEPETARDEVVRSIKYMVLDQRAGEQQRRIAGIVVASQTTNIAFETSGQVIRLLRNAGDAVTQGDLIAQLDPEPYLLQVNQAENSLAQANASRDDARKKFDQQRQLSQQGFATRTALDTAEANLKNAQGAVGVAESQLDLARRDLSKTDLKAPFSGVIARKLVDTYEEVTGGQAIYAIQSSGEGKIEAALPETLINSVSLGSVVDVSFPPLGDATVQGRVTEISPLTGDANAYPIEVALQGTPPGLRSGMSAEVSFSFASADTGKAFVVPISAVLPDPGPDAESHVYVFDRATGKVSKRAVTVANISDNSLQVLGDLTTGDVIATAGVSFLYDGMQVDLFDPEKLR